MINAIPPHLLQTCVSIFKISTVPLNVGSVVLHCRTASCSYKGRVQILVSIKKLLTKKTLIALRHKWFSIT